MENRIVFFIGDTETTYQLQGDVAARPGNI